MDISDEKRVNPLAEGMMGRRTVVLSGKITNESVSEISRRLFELQMRSSDRINMLFDSGGGSANAALQLCDIMSTILTAPVHGIAVGACGSAATFVMLHCKKRLSTTHSRFLIHSGTMSEITIPANQTTSTHLEQLRKDALAFEEKMAKLYMNRLTPAEWKDGDVSDEQKRDFVRSLISRGDQRFDAWFSAEEAIKLGLIEEIVTSKFDIFPEQAEEERI